MRNRQSGVAVIIVLGVLALMMVLGVAFSVTMRVERAGAANYANAVNSRQLVGSALARAIADINSTVGSGYYPEWDVRVSSNGTTRARLARTDALTYVPEVLHGVAQAADANLRWTRIRSNGMGGHIAYLTLNCTDLLDLHYVGGAGREGGMEPFELPLAPQFLTAAQTNMLAIRRTVDSRYESLAEFKMRVPGVPADILVSESRYLTDNNRTNAVYIGGTVTDLQANRAVIVSRILKTVEEAGQQLSLQHAGMLFDCLLDYIDEDSVPRNLDGPNVEAVPMLNEVGFANAGLLPIPGGVGFVARLQYETWFPFVSTNQFGHRFRIAASYRVRIEEKETASEMVGPDTEVMTDPFTAAGFQLHTFNPSDDVRMQFAGVALTNTFDIQVAFSNLRVIVQNPGHSDHTQVVDRVAGKFEFTYNGPASGAIQMAPAGPVGPPGHTYQALDPRFNWQISQFVIQPATWSAINTITAQILAMGNPTMQRGSAMHTSDRGRLYSPLELGNLPVRADTGGPWQTFRVFGQASARRHALLENFTVHANAVRRGLVNVNTRDRDLLQSAFTNMPLGYVGNSTRLTAAEIEPVLNLIENWRNSGNVFRRVTDLLDLDWISVLGTRSSVEMESMAAYSTGMLGVRQNLFTILVAASSGEEGMGERAAAAVQSQTAKRAVAVVWRDPEPNAVGLHHTALLLFKWLED